MSHCGLWVTKNRPITTSNAGMIAVANMSRQSVRLLWDWRIMYPMAVPNKAPTAWNANALNTRRPRQLLGMLSEITRCAVG